MAIVDEALDEMLYEVVDGQVVEKPPAGTYSTWLASFLGRELGTFAFERQLGHVVNEMLFRIDRQKNLQRRPNVAFVSYERWPRERRIRNEAAWDVIPELAIEVNSPSNKGSELVRKIREYFQAGVGRVWVVYPSVSLVYVYTSRTQVRILQRGDELDGEDLLPGFRLPLNSFFVPADETDPA